MQGQETTPRTADRLEDELVMRPDGWIEDSEEEFGAHVRPEDWPPRRVLTFRDLLGMQRRLKGNRSLLSLRSSSGRANSLRLALAVLSVALWAYIVHAHGVGSWLGIGWTAMAVAAVANVVLSLLIGLRVVAIGEWILRLGAGDLDYRTTLGGKDEMARLCQALEKLRDRSVRVVKLQLVERMTARLEQRNAELRETIKSVERAQDRIVAQQKAAELGELTSGVAHEIRNPLNFVKNFSEDVRELMAEMAAGIHGQGDAIGDNKMRRLRELQREIDENLDRIDADTTRADTIVQQMLMLGETQGAAQDVDLNGLVSEHARLACRAAEQQDRRCKVRLREAYDERIGEVRVVAQAIARVVLNVVGNACYAVNERSAEAPDGYEPTVWVITRGKETEFEIEVRDNGPGIDEAIREKVTTPFFTTKPPSVGAGLGLSQCADAARQHGGKIALGSSASGGAAIRIVLPGSSACER
ncbi:MAG: HAMP domain-containing sensor histidine kinase [Bryobacterales bacterium]|nr:HAMP domain-containing sensor histidine kinase [Bryobacterales bacterium]